MSFRKFIQGMKHSPIRNYAIPGLTSWLVGGKSDHGTVRLFECSREHQESITPHSHRFDFHCMVLAGEVRNIIWEPKEVSFGTAGGDLYAVTDLEFGGAPGEYERRSYYVSRFTRSEKVYCEGDQYSMVADQIHSIFFSAGAEVLFFEGPTKDSHSVILEPYVNGQTILTFKVEDWMFQRGKLINKDTQ